MGRGFGRGAKAVAIVTHSQAKPAKKAPRGLRIGRKHRRKMYKHQHDSEDPNSMLDTGDNKNNQQKKKKNNAPKSLEQQIAGIHFQENVARGRKLKGLRKQIMSQVKNLRRKEHMKRESQSKAEVREIERRVAAKARRQEEQRRLTEQREKRKAAASASRAGKKKSTTSSS